MKELIPWGEFSQSPYYKSQDPVSQAKLRDEWYGYFAEDTYAKGMELPEDDYDQFVKYSNKGTANENLYKFYESAYEGKRGALGYGILHNWVAQKMLQGVSALDEKFEDLGVPGAGKIKDTFVDVDGTLVDKGEYISGYRRKPKGKAEKVLMTFGGLAPDMVGVSGVSRLATRGLMGLGVRGLAMAGGRALLEKKAAQIGLTSLATLGSNIASMQTLSGVRAAVMGEDVGEAVQEGTVQGTVSGTADAVVDAAASLIPNKAVQTAVRLVAGTAAGAGADTLVGGDNSIEAFTENLMLNAGMRIGTVGAEVGMDARKRAIEFTAQKKLKEIHEAIPPYAQLKAEGTLAEKSQATDSIREFKENVIDAYAEAIEDSTCLSSEFARQAIHGEGTQTKLVKDLINERGETISAIERIEGDTDLSPLEKELRKSYIKDTAGSEIRRKSRKIAEESLIKIEGFDEMVADLAHNYYSPKEILNLSKGQLWKIYNDGIEKMIYRKNEQLRELVKKTPLNVLDPEATSNAIGGVEFELAALKLYREKGKEHPLSTREYDPGVDLSTKSIEDIERYERERNEIAWADKKGGYEAAKEVTKRQLLLRFKETIGKTLAGKKMVQLDELKTKEAAFLDGQLQEKIKPLHRLSKLHDAAVWHYTYADWNKKPEVFDEFCRKHKISDEEKSMIKDIGEYVFKVNQEYSEVIKSFDPTGYREIPRYMPFKFMKKMLQSHKLKEEFISEMVQDAQFMKAVGDMGYYYKDGKVVREFTLTGDEGKAAMAFDVYTTEQRKQLLRKFLGDYDTIGIERKYGHLQMARVFRNVPTKYLETTAVGSLSEYYARSSNRLMEIKHFGESDQVLKHAMQEASDEIASAKEYSNEDYVEMMSDIQKYFKMLTFDRDPNGWEKTVLDNVLSFNTMRKMNLSVIGQTGQFFSPIVRAGTAVPWAKAIKSNVANGKVKYYNFETGKFDYMDVRNVPIRAGSASHYIMDDMMGRMAGEMNGLMQRAVSKQLKIVKFKRVDAANRHIAACSGWFYADQMMGSINKILSSKEAMKMDAESAFALVQKKKMFGHDPARRIGQLDIDIKKVIERGRGTDGKYHLTQNELLSAARAFEIQTNFRSAKQDLPVFFWDHGLGTAITQYNTYNYNRSRELKTFVVDEFIKHKNPAPLMWLLSAGGLVGGGLVAARTLITGRDLPEDAVLYYASALSAFGAFGVLGDMYAMGAYGAFNFGPTADDLLRATNAFSSLCHGNPSRMATLMATEVPFINPIVRRALYEMEKNGETDYEVGSMGGLGEIGDIGGDLGGL